ncbi:myb-related transcription factor, partner of profilin isoform X2 [Cololabis saira]|uniref:myb-related transcription factor, partner of profilin isoform X2 n=1 Tax=Cololabis saira TaxID=129043 RepID=UPI002AD4F773|nr:myb-related transcription factor, partner of profilin isoform X2 [Cololabis saira]
MDVVTAPGRGSGTMSSPVLLNQDSIIRFKKRKARFTFSEVHILLDEVRKHRLVVVGKFNRGVPTDVKKRTWAEIAARVNEIGECQREVIEVIKKWSDLKCDTKRKVAAMRSGTVPNRGLNSRLSRDLNQTEKIVLQILEMDDGQNLDLGPLEDEDGEEEDEDDEEMEEDDDMMEGSPNGGETAMGPPGGMGGLSDAETAFGDSDEDQEDVPSSTPAAKLADGPAVPLVNNGVLKPALPLPGPAPGAVSGQDPGPGPASEQPPPGQAPGSAPGPAPAPGPGPVPDPPQVLPAPGPASSTPDGSSVLQSAQLSLQEQHSTNVLLETVSRSLELLAESVTQLAETQTEFVRESLTLQRETVTVLRDFTGGAIALIHDKLNGRPL